MHWKKQTEGCKMKRSKVAYHCLAQHRLEPEITRRSIYNKHVGFKLQQEMESYKEEIAQLNQGT